MAGTGLEGLKLDRRSDVPLYRQLKRAILGEIESGRLAPGDRVPPEIEWSKTLGVSQITVIQALRELVREGYLSRHRGKGTFVTRAHKRVVTVAMSDVGALTDQFMRQTMLGIEDEVRRDGSALHMFMTHRYTLSEAGGRSLTPVTMKEGLLICPPIDPAEIEGLQDAGVPLVTLSTEYEGLEPPTVLADDAAVGRVMGEYLQRKKCRRIGAMVGLVSEQGDPRRYLSDRLFGGLREVLGEGAGRIRKQHLFRTDYARGTAEKLVPRLLSMRERPDAVILFGDNAIRGTLDALRAKGVEPGKDLVLLGYRDTPDASAFVIPTVGHPLREMGRQAVRLLGKLVRGESLKRRKVVVKPLLDGLS